MKKVIAYIFISISVFFGNSLTAQESHITAIETSDTEKDNEELIKKIIIVADSMFYNKKWDSALKYYQRVNSLSPNHEYAQRQIKEIRLIKRQMSNNKTPDIISNARAAQEKRTENSYYTR